MKEVMGNQPKHCFNMVRYNFIRAKCLFIKHKRNCLKMEFLSGMLPNFFPFLHDYFHSLQLRENTLQSF